MITGEDLVDVMMLTETRLRKSGKAKLAAAVAASVQTFCEEAGIERRPFAIDKYEIERIAIAEEHGTKHTSAVDLNDFLAEFIVTLIKNPSTPMTDESEDER